MRPARQRAVIGTQLDLPKRQYVFVELEELGGAGDVVSVFARAFVQDAVALNRLGVRIGEEGEGVVRFSNEVARLFRGVDADRDGRDAERLQRGEIFFDTP